MMKTSTAPRMALSALAGKPAPVSLLTDPAARERADYERRPDPDDLTQSVNFGTSGERPPAGAGAKALARGR